LRIASKSATEIMKYSAFQHATLTNNYKNNSNTLTVLLDEDLMIQFRLLRVAGTLGLPFELCRLKNV